jgi:hypothetical protein
VIVPYCSFELKRPAKVELCFKGFPNAWVVSSSLDAAHSVVDLPDRLSPFFDDLVASFLDFSVAFAASLSNLFFAFSVSAIL